MMVHANLVTGRYMFEMMIMDLNNMHAIRGYLWLHPDELPSIHTDEEQ